MIRGLVDRWREQRTAAAESEARIEEERKRYAAALWVTHAWTNGPTPCGWMTEGAIAERSSMHLADVTCPDCLRALGLCPDCHEPIVRDQPCWVDPTTLVVRHDPCPTRKTP